MYTFIFDIGKTNIKGQVIDELGRSIWGRSCANGVSASAPYPHFDVDQIWQWLKDTLRDAAQVFEIGALNVSTHGACAVLLNRNGALVLPVLDYEHSGIAADDAEYRQLRPRYSETFSPDLGAGLNLGRQLWWLQRNFPEEFTAVEMILMYPQYWVYRLTGIAVSEVTSLGCHTDLWAPQRRCYSSLVDKLGISDRLPPMVEATSSVGSVSTELAVELGLSVECKVFAGVHDSNASFARYLAAGHKEPFTVISTGTWIVAMCNEGKLGALSEQRDMLANVNVVGEPIACSRFMGGREFDLLCRITDAEAGDPVTGEAIQHIVDSRTFALPPFVSGSGPFQRRAAGGEIIGTARSGTSLAALYLALVMDFQLDLLEAPGKILFGGIARKNPMVCRLVAQLRGDQSVLAADDSASTIRGAWCLSRWGSAMPEAITVFETILPAEIPGLLEYRSAWRALVDTVQVEDLARY